MKPQKQIHDLKTLDAELARLRMQATQKEEMLKENLLCLEQNFFQLLKNTFFSAPGTNADKDRQANGPGTGQDRFTTFTQKIADRLLNRYLYKLARWIVKQFTCGNCSRG